MYVYFSRRTCYYELLLFNLKYFYILVCKLSCFVIKMVAERKGVSNDSLQQKNGTTTEHEHQRPVPAIKRAQKCRVKLLDGTELEIVVDVCFVIILVNKSIWFVAQ